MLAHTLGKRLIQLGPTSALRIEYQNKVMFGIQGHPLRNEIAGMLGCAGSLPSHQRSGIKCNDHKPLLAGGLRGWLGLLAGNNVFFSLVRFLKHLIHQAVRFGRMGIEVFVAFLIFGDFLTRLTR